MLPRTPGLSLLAFLALCGVATAADLKITDSRGTEVVLTGASIDYGGFLGSEQETQGIRVLQGDGSVLVKWTDVASIKVLRRDDTAKPPRVELEIALKKWQESAGSVVQAGQNEAVGEL